MLVTFKTEFAASVTLFDSIALSLLNMMGYSKLVPGAIRAEDVPEALNSLNKAIAGLPEEKPMQDEDQEDERVSLRNRALPLITLLRSAADTKSYVIWEEGL